MKQYNVIFFNNATEIVEAYGYILRNRRAVFDLGHNCTLTKDNVKIVEPLGLAVTE